MPDRTIRIPGPDHPIAIAATPNRIVVTAGGRVVADTTAALTLREANHPPVHYIPRKDVRMDELSRSETRSYCPYKGEAGYFHLAAGGNRARDAVWSYETPHDAVAAIRDHVAFYPDRVDAIDERAG